MPVAPASTGRPRVGPLSARAALAAGIAVSLTLVGGCAGPAAIHSASAKAAKPASGDDRALARAEQAVQRAPQDASARAGLAQAYLAAGRFASAATTFDDAMALGDNSARTALGLALAKIGTGRTREAVALLDDWRSEIPAGDLGLALALAGEPARGVAILTDAVRGGDSSPKLRQNLAYAYALDGRWPEARLMAAQDLPAAELDQRMAVWALSTLPDRGQERIAGLIGAPVRSDPGQPAMLALKLDPAREQLAVETAVPAASAPAALDAAPAPELPAVAAAETTMTLEQNLAVQATPAAPAPTRKLPRPSVASAFAAPVPVTTAVSAPAAVAPSAAPAAVHAPRGAALAAVTVPAARARIAAGGTHVVQLGAFSSQQGARRAWGIFVRRTPGLASYRMAITTAMVRGKTVWRVAAAGLAGTGAASGLCSSVKARGGACFAYAVPLRTPPQQPTGPGRDLAGPQRARR